VKARLRGYVDVEQWDGSVDEALRLGLIQLRVVNAPMLHAWHLSTEDGPVRMNTGDWIVTHAGCRRVAVPRAQFPLIYELL
jgi:hypothetical protein